MAGPAPWTSSRSTGGCRSTGAWWPPAGTSTAARTASASASRACGRELAATDPLFGLDDHPVYNVRPLLHEPGPISTASFLSRRGIGVRRGERLRLTATYDDEVPHPQAMGVMHLYVAEGRAPGERCAPLPTDIRQEHLRADSIAEPPLGVPGRPRSPRVIVPLNQLDPEGQIASIPWPAGRTTALESGASIDIRRLALLGAQAVAARGGEADVALRGPGAAQRRARQRPVVGGGAAGRIPRPGRRVHDPLPAARPLPAVLPVPPADDAPAGARGRYRRAGAHRRPHHPLRRRRGGRAGLPPRRARARRGRRGRRLAHLRPPAGRAGGPSGRRAAAPRALPDVRRHRGDGGAADRARRRVHRAGQRRGLGAADARCASRAPGSSGSTSRGTRSRSRRGLEGAGRRPGQPARRAHGLQRRPLPAVRDRAGRDGVGRGSGRAARGGRRAGGDGRVRP